MKFKILKQEEFVIANSKNEKSDKVLGENHPKKVVDAHQRE
jgi:hypothetical protein